MTGSRPRQASAIGSSSRCPFCGQLIAANACGTSANTLAPFSRAIRRHVWLMAVAPRIARAPNDEVAPIPAVHETTTELGGSSYLGHFIPAGIGMTGRSWQKGDWRRRQRCAPMSSTSQRLGEVNSPVLTACADAMRDLPLRKMPEEVILASQRARNLVNVGLRASGRKALLASTTWSGGYVLARQGVTGTRVTSAGS